MRFAGPAQTARPGCPRTGRGCFVCAGTWSEDGKFLGQAFRTAMRTGRPAPIRGTHQHFAVLGAVLTM